MSCFQTKPNSTINPHVVMNRDTVCFEEKNARTALSCYGPVGGVPFEMKYVVYIPISCLGKTCVVSSYVSSDRAILYDKNSGTPWPSCFAISGITNTATVTKIYPTGPSAAKVVDVIVSSRKHRNILSVQGVVKHPICREIQIVKVISATNHRHSFVLRQGNVCKGQ